MLNRVCFDPQNLKGIADSLKLSKRIVELEDQLQQAKIARLDKPHLPSIPEHEVYPVPSIPEHLGNFSFKSGKTITGWSNDVLLVSIKRLMDSGFQ